MIAIGSYQFKNKKEATNAVRKIITNLFDRNEKIINQHSEHWNFFLDLIRRHPVMKIDLSFVEHFEIIKNFAGHIAVNYKLHRTEPESFSWLKCVSQNNESEKSKLRQAMRKAVRYQIVNFRDNSRTEFCELCFCNLSGTKIHVDHVTPFERLCQNFTIGKSTPKKFNEKKRPFRYQFPF